MLKNSLIKNVEELVKNKIVLYIIFIFAIANAFGYLATNNYEAFIFFTLVLFVSKEFTNHIGLALLSSMVSTNLLLSIVKGRRVYETFVSGMEDSNNKNEESSENGIVEKDANHVVKNKVKDEAQDKDAEDFQNDINNFNKLETMLSHQEGLISSLDRIDRMIGQLSVMSSSVAAKEDIVRNKKGKQGGQGVPSK